MTKDEWYLKLEKWAFDDDRLHRLPLALLRPLAEHLSENDEKSVDWEVRAIPEAKRVFANGERAEQEKTFEDVARPAMEWLAKNKHPHMSIIIECDRAELLEGVECATRRE